MSGDAGEGVHEALASPTRRKIVALMQARDRTGPHAGSSVWDAHELAAATGLHVTTVRFHLEVLRRAGLVVSRRQERHTSGRPRIGFRLAVSPSDGSDRPYRMLADLLAAGLGEDAADRSRRAERLGREWATALLSPERPASSTAAESPPESPVEPVATLVSRIFADLGFAPSHDVEPGYDIFELHACPFIDVAAAHPDVVCGMHRGLLRGLVDSAGGQGRATGVQSFVEPGLCVAHVTSGLPTG